MCLLAICQDNKFSLEDFNKIFNKNPDGVGYGWIKDGKSHWKKGLMTAQEAWDYHETLEPPFVIHFRKKSFGEICKELTHPFVVSKESPLDLEGETEHSLLFQNGSSAWWEEFLNASGRYLEPQELMSDTRAFSIIIAGDNQRFLEKMTGSKFVVIDPKTPKLWTYRDFKEENGILLSNDDWKTVYVKKKEKTAETLTPTYYQRRNGLKNGNNAENCGTTTYNYTQPWEGNNDQKHRVLRFLLNRLTENAAKKLWNRYQKRHILSDALDKAIKVLKQQDKTFTPEKEKRVRRFAEADLMGWPESTTHLRNGGIKTLNVWEDYDGRTITTEITEDIQKSILDNCLNQTRMLNEFNQPILDKKDINPGCCF